jgi:hypothetical protein
MRRKLKRIHFSATGLFYKRNGLFLFMAVLSKTFFALMSGHFMTFSFLSAWHRIFLCALAFGFITSTSAG